MKRQARKHYSLPLSPHILLKIPPKDEEGRDDAQWWCNFPQGGSPIIFYFPCLLSVSRIEFSACRGRQDTRQAGKNTRWTIKCPGVPLPSLSHLSLSLNLVLFWEQSIICPCEMLGSSFFSLYFFSPTVVPVMEINTITLQNITFVSARSPTIELVNFLVVMCLYILYIYFIFLVINAGFQRP